MEGAALTMESTSEDALPVDSDVSPDSSPAPADGQSAEPSIAPARIVEAILLASDTQLPASKIASIMGVGTAKDVRAHIETLNEEYTERAASFRIEEIAGGYQILTLPIFNTWLTKLLRVRQETKLTTAAMETLSVVAYKQPCTRADVEAIRGVAAGDMLNKLREMNLVKIVGRAEDLGRPILYGTTKRFLEAFGLPSLEDLPQVEALKLAPSSKAASTDSQENVEHDTTSAELGDAASRVIPFNETVEEDAGGA